MSASKFHNKKTLVDGIVFDSGKEAAYYKTLRDKQEAGEISGLRTQVIYELIPAIYEYREEVRHLKTKDKIVTKKKPIQSRTCYVADFVYTDNATGEEMVVDVKSAITRKHPVYRLKKKMMLAFKGIKIIEIN